MISDPVKKKVKLKNREEEKEKQLSTKLLLWRFVFITS